MSPRHLLEGGGVFDHGVAPERLLGIGPSSEFNARGKGYTKGGSKRMPR